jgi:hypothetical protein
VNDEEAAHVAAFSFGATAVAPEYGQLTGSSAGGCRGHGHSRVEQRQPGKAKVEVRSEKTSIPTQSPHPAGPE